MTEYKLKGLNGNGTGRIKYHTISRRGTQRQQNIKCNYVFSSIYLNDEIIILIGSGSQLILLLAYSSASDTHLRKTNWIHHNCARMFVTAHLIV